MSVLVVEEAQNPCDVLTFIINPIHQGKGLVGFLVAFCIDVVRGCVEAIEKGVDPLPDGVAGACVVVEGAGCLKLGECVFG